MLSWNGTSIGEHARLSFDDVENTGSARPLEFPAPTIGRGKRIVCTMLDAKSGHYHHIRNLLVSDSKEIGQRNSHSRFNHHHPRIRNRSNDSFSSSYYYENQNHDEENEESAVVGYYLKRKISKTMHGSIFKAVEMKRRNKFPQEDIVFRRDASKRNSLNRIGEHDECVHGDQTTSSSNNVHGSDYVWEPSGKVFIVKISSWARVGRLRGKCLEDPIKEIQAMQLLGNYHPNVIQSIEALQDDSYLYSIMPYYKDGDMYTLVMDGISSGRQRLHESPARDLFKQLLDALYHFQQKGVCHRDISLENIMIQDKTLKLIDFGLALRVPYIDPSTTTPHSTTDVSSGSSRLLITAQGQGANLTYMAPEVVAREPVFDGFAIDLWAAGVILYIMLIGHKPFEWAHGSDEQFVRLAEDGNLRENLKFWKIGISEEACDLLQSMLWKNKSRRLTLAEVMEHPWMKGTTSGGGSTNVCQKETESEKENTTKSVKSACLDRQHNSEEDVCSISEDDDTTLSRENEDGNAKAIKKMTISTKDGKKKKNKAVNRKSLWRLGKKSVANK